MIAYAFNKSLGNVRESFNVALIDVLLGQQAIRFHYLQPFSSYVRKASKSNRQPITTNHIHEAIVIFGLALSLCFFALILEIISEKLKLQAQ